MNMTHKGWLGLMVASSTLVAALIGPLSAQSDNDDKALLDRAKALFKPLPESVALENNALTAKRVALGKALFLDRKSTRLNSSHMSESRMPSSA